MGVGQLHQLHLTKETKTLLRPRCDLVQTRSLELFSATVVIPVRSLMDRTQEPHLSQFDEAAITLDRTASSKTTTQNPSAIMRTGNASGPELLLSRVLVTGEREETPVDQAG